MPARCGLETGCWPSQATYLDHRLDSQSRLRWLGSSAVPGDDAGRAIRVLGVADSPHDAGSRHLASDCGEHAVAAERLRDLPSELRVDDSAEGFTGFSLRSAV
jgi:hypothetical protein